MKTKRDAIQLAGSSLGEHRHICAFFDSRPEEYRVLMPFIREGFEVGDRAVHIIDPELRDDHLAQLTAADIDVEAAQSSDQLSLLNWEDAHLRGGRFDQDQMLELLNDILSGGAARGTPVRLVSHQEWALEGCPGVHDILEYEARANYVMMRYDDPVLCVYNTADFGAGVALGMLRTHPVVIIGGLLMENPFFVPPEVFVRELRGRKDRPYRPAAM
jgi:hypothetical protein